MLPPTLLREQQRPCLSASSTLPDRKSQFREGQESENDPSSRSFARSFATFTVVRTLLFVDQDKSYSPRRTRRARRKAKQ